jgi:hypothetical protein
VVRQRTHWSARQIEQAIQGIKEKIRVTESAGPLSLPKRLREAEEAERVYQQAWELHRKSHLPPRERSGLTKFFDSINDLVAAARDYHDLALEQAYTPELVAAVRHLRVGNAAGVEAVIQFLEVDPWFFRSGYRKADLIRHLCKMPLPQEVQDRLRKVVLQAVDGRDRREFRSYCRLARKVDSSELRQQLQGRLTWEDSDIRRRARWVLHSLERMNWATN